MKLNQLRDVMAVAERGSLRAAARHLGVAQPALTRSILPLTPAAEYSCDMLRRASGHIQAPPRRNEGAFPGGFESAAPPPKRLAKEVAA